MHFINRLQHPTVSLDSSEDIERFLDNDVEYIESTGFFRNKNVPLGVNFDDLILKTRVIAFIFDTEDSETELKYIKETGKILAQRMALRIGIVTDAKLIRKYKEMKGTFWFPDNVQLTTIIIQRYDKGIFFHDLLQLESIVQLSHWINKKSIMPVQEMFLEANKVLDLVGQQVIIALTDFGSSDPDIKHESKQLVETTL